jgi:hypothetical protein
VHGLSPFLAEQLKNVEARLIACRLRNRLRRFPASLMTRWTVALLLCCCCQRQQSQNIVLVGGQEEQREDGSYCVRHKNTWTNVANDPAEVLRRRTELSEQESPEQTAPAPLRNRNRDTISRSSRNVFQESGEPRRGR